MIVIKTGKPRAGKSLGLLLDILDELEFGTRFIVTNLSLKLDELNAYFQVRGKFVDVFYRVRLVTRDECRQFWRYRGTYTILPGATARKPGLKQYAGDDEFDVSAVVAFA